MNIADCTDDLEFDNGEEDALPVGTVVMLKSGSPRMTVSGSPEDGCVRCVWIYKGKVRQMNAWVGMLEIAPSKQIAPTTVA